MPLLLGAFARRRGRCNSCCLAAIVVAAAASICVSGVSPGAQASGAVAALESCEAEGCQLPEEAAAPPDEGAEAAALQMSLLQHTGRSKGRLAPSPPHLRASRDSCAGHCNSRYDDKRSCQCNSHCLKFGNCCDDYRDMCLSCSRLGCSSAFKPQQACQCNDACRGYGNCCHDFEATCKCEDTRGWTNGYSECSHVGGNGVHKEYCQPTGWTCAGYVKQGWCAGGKPVPGKEYAFGAAYIYPERACCGCGGGAITDTGPWLPRGTVLPAYRQGNVFLKGIAYGPSPELAPGVLLPNDDFMSPQAKPLWNHRGGRGDLAIMRRLGANTVRLYGNDPSQDHAPFLEELASQRLSAVVGISDWPYLQMPGSCAESKWNCFSQIYDSYKANLLGGFTRELRGGGRAYHDALKALIVINEPEIKIGGLRDICKVVVSAVDAILQAEKDLDVRENLLALTVTFSFRDVFGGPGLGAMKELYNCIMAGNKGNAKYEAKNDVIEAFRARWVNGLNAFAPPSHVADVFLDKYGEMFWRPGLQIPLFMGEYHNVDAGVEADLQAMLAFTRKYPFFLGACYFEFSVRYDKVYDSGKPNLHERQYGMLGLDEKCPLYSMPYFGKDYKAYGFLPRPDATGVSQHVAVSRAYGGEANVVLPSCARK
eukprot:TRINITY_DN3195_c0_g4_i1.p1 TRINITY_DN3195_c0_g4~~TRINITY_DN3195_c0_g4_i1.p1  ORF type:complete len:700 (+),score=110.49 TRINITY_DN3195_c0_g4_i1:146-2101(+)